MAYFKRFLITIFCLFLSFFLIMFPHPSFATAVDTYNVQYDLTQYQTLIQNEFVYHCFGAYILNTPYWNNILKPIFEEFDENQYDIYIGRMNYDDRLEFYIRFFHLHSGSFSYDTYTSEDLGNNFTTTLFFGTVPVTGYNVTYYPSTKEGSSSSYSQAQFKRPYYTLYIKSDLLMEFTHTVLFGNGNDYSPLLNSINSSLNNINSVDADILSSLNSLSSSLSAIQSNTSANYSQQISAISGKIDNILNDNQEIISQNDEMIQQQEEINDNLEQLSTDIEDVKDTLTDDTIQSTASDLPSTNIQDPTESGISTIFQSIYNAFCTGQAQDIVFPIPFTNKNITLSPYYVSDMLNNNGASWVYVLIQAFWGYLIGRFIVSDISKKIDKVKSGNIENIENTNIKEDML